jgi:DNA (cytosine-5)-methyltransferase 1
METQEKRVMSLFSGCGGMDLGFEGGFQIFKNCLNLDIHSDWIDKDISKDQVILKNNPYTTVFANDINHSAKLAWDNYFKKFGHDESIYTCESIVDLIKKYQSGEFSFPNNIDILTGGFPCQDFSNAGKRLGFSSTKSHYGRIKTNQNEENRGNLYLWMKKTIEIVKPKIFIAENVKGLISIKDAKDIIVRDFSKANNNDYLILTPKVLLSADYGIPQTRQRIIFIGFSKNALTNEALQALSSDNIPKEYDPYPIKTYSDDTDGHQLKKYVNSGSILLDLKEPDKSKDISQQHYSKARFLSNNSQGQIEVDLNSLAPTIRSEHHGNIEFRRLNLANGGKNIHELKKGLDQRRLTVRECARIQTFPDDYQFIINIGKNRVSGSEAYKLIGNAVPPLLAYHLARRIDQNWSLYFGD